MFSAEADVFSSQSKSSRPLCRFHVRLVEQEMSRFLWWIQKTTLVLGKGSSCGNVTHSTQQMWKQKKLHF